MAKKDTIPKEDREIRMAELRAVIVPDPENNDGKTRMIVEGYAIVFDTPATHYGFTEIIDRDALNDADLSDVPLRYNHNDTWLILARTRNKSLELTVDDKGLKIRAELIDTQTNRDVYKSIEAELLDKMSFSFSATKSEWDYETDTRTVKAISKLYDVSVVDTPFYEETSIYARALGELDNHKEALDNEKTQAIEVERLKTEILSQC